jgi:hypothetical protein
VAVIAILAVAVPAHAKGQASQVTITNPSGSGPGAGGSGGGSQGGGSQGGGSQGGGSQGGGSQGGGSNPAAGSGQVGTSGAALLAVPIRLAGPAAESWLGDTGVFQEPSGHPARSALGPALDVRVTYSCGTISGSLRQVLFPFAKGGAIVHTLAGQRFCDGALAASWWRMGTHTMVVLRSHGLPFSAAGATGATGSGVANNAATAGTGGQGATARMAGAAESAGTRQREGGTTAGTHPGSAGALAARIGIGVLIAAVVAGAAMLAVQRRRREIAA